MGKVRTGSDPEPPFVILRLDPARRGRLRDLSATDDLPKSVNETHHGIITSVTTGTLNMLISEKKKNGGLRGYALKYNKKI